MTENKLVLKFPGSLMDKPIAYEVVKRFNLEFNILKADISPDSEGLLVIHLKGSDKDYKDALEYFRELNIEIQPLSKDITRNNKACTNCGACVSHCPSGALFIEDRKTMKVGFDPEKCVACEACIPVCSYKAMCLKI